MSPNKTLSNLKIIFGIAAAVAISSLFHFSTYSEGFRISGAVIVLPLLLMTVAVDIHSFKVCFATAIFVFATRSALDMLEGGQLSQILALYLPNVIFYLCYGIIFSLFCVDKQTVSYKRLLLTLFYSDFLSNVIELSFTHGSGEYVTAIIATVFAVAVVRSLVTWFILTMWKQYLGLLQNEEHEKRYQRLFLMTTSLKNEIFFMRKNSEEIERVMGTAYKLYENLSTLSNLPPEVKTMSLALAKDVHEIKKDYIRIITGIENEISEDYDEKRMKFSDILHILTDTTRLHLNNRGLKINLDFNCNDDFFTEEHYEIMNILKNLVTNAIEAMESGECGSSISIEQSITGKELVMSVKDDGPGISKRHINHIFKMGYSTKFDEKTGNIYRGVGLNGVKNTVEDSFGGKIDVQSTYGEGTEFTVTIPKEAVVLIP